MDILITNEFLNCLMISSIVSVINMSLIQKFKEFSYANTSNHIFVLNLIFSFLIGICFSITFYNVSFYYSIWISFFSFIGAPGIYNMLKKKNIFTGDSADDKKRE